VSTYLKCQVRFDYSPTPLPDQVFVNTYDIVVPSGWGQWTEFTGPLETLLGQIAAFMPSKIDPTEVRFYRPYDPLPEGRPLHVSPLTASWSGTVSACPPQCCMTLTEKTKHRRNWGRVYWPAPTSSQMTASGTISSAVVNSMVAGARQMYNAWIASDIYPVVRTEKKLDYNGMPGWVSILDDMPNEDIDGGFLHPILRVQMDDVADIQRRRRHPSPALRSYEDLTNFSL
jgi:hypothetical protein